MAQNRESMEDARKLIAIRVLMENFGRLMSDDLQNLWLDLLAPYPAALVEKAVMQTVSSYAYKTLPPFAVIREALDELAGTGEKALELQAIAEWGALNKALEKYNFYAAPPTLHPTTEHVLRLMGGWNVACEWSSRDFDFKRRDFIDLWMKSHGRVDQMQLGAAGVLHALASGRRHKALLPDSAFKTGGNPANDRTRV